jgi:hypothetical protein
VGGRAIRELRLGGSEQPDGQASYYNKIKS